jgi:hypothetical protein
MTDIVELLRAFAPPWTDTGALAYEAADEIERLRAELDALRQQEPVAWLRKYGFRFNRDIEPEGDGEVPLYAAPKPGERQ